MARYIHSLLTTGSHQRLLKILRLFLIGLLRKKHRVFITRLAGQKISDFEYATLVNETLDLRRHNTERELSEYLKLINEVPYQRNTAMTSGNLHCSKYQVDDAGGSV